MEGSNRGLWSDRRGAILTATQEVDAVVHETTYTCTLDGHRASVTVPSGRTLTYSTDFAGRPTAITATPPGGGAAVPVVADVDYLPGGPPTALELGPVAGRVSESLDHDWQYRRTGQTVTAPGPTTHLDLTYGYDAAGNLETVGDTTGGRDAAYTYDHLGRLAGATWPDGNRTYTYDPIGNMTSLVADEGLAGQGELLLTYQSNGTGTNTPILNDMASSQGGSPLWSTTVASDDVGNMTTDGASTYTYGLRNQLDTRALDTPTFDNTFSADGRLARTDRTDTAGTLDIILDTSGQRLAKLEDGVWRDYVFLGSRLVGYLDASATEPVLVITDHIGLPIQAIDPTGALVWDAKAEPYGQLRGTLDTTHDPGLRYPGQWQDHLQAETTCTGPTCTFPGPLDRSFSLYENGYRWYRPDLGRYTQADPVGQSGGIHLQLYAYASPYRYVDPHGLMILEVCCSLLEIQGIRERMLRVGQLQGWELDHSRPFPGGRPVPAAQSGCLFSGTQAGPGRPITDYRGNLGRGPCLDACTRVHEQVHRDYCRRALSLDDWLSQHEEEEPIAYLAEYRCLREALMRGKVVVEVDELDNPRTEEIR